jgi:hypoxanthine-guanine phosphoribosyltransferase
VVKIKVEKVAQKLADLMADSRLTLSDWKYAIPFYLMKQEDSIVITAKNLADGVNYQIDRHGLDIPDKFIVAYPEDKLVNINGEEYRGHRN